MNDISTPTKMAGVEPEQSELLKFGNMITNSMINLQETMTKQFELLQNTMARLWYSEEERKSSEPSSDESSNSRENGLKKRLKKNGT